MPRGVRKQVPSEEEIKHVLPNQQQPAKQMPMQGLRRLQKARMQSGMGLKMNNLMSAAARQSPYSQGQ